MAKQTRPRTKFRKPPRRNPVPSGTQNNDHTITREVKTNPLSWGQVLCLSTKKTPPVRRPFSLLHR